MVLPLQKVHVVILGKEELFEMGKNSIKDIWLDKDKMILEIVYERILIGIPPLSS